MKKFFTALLVIFIIAVVMVVIGGAIIRKNPDKYPLFAKDQFTEKQLTEEEIVTSLYLGIASDDVDIFPSEDGKLTIIYYESETHRYDYGFENGKATFNQDTKFDIRNWFKLTWHDDRPNMKIYLPDTVNANLSLKVASGEINFVNSNYSVQNLTVSVASGQVVLSHITANNCDITSSSGDVILTNVISNDADINISSGTLNVKNSTLTTIDIRISSGDFVSDNLTSDNVDCTVASGSIRLGLTGVSTDYTINGESSSGSIVFNFGGTEIRMGNKILYGNGPKMIKAKISSGSMTLITD